MEGKQANLWNVKEPQVSPWAKSKGFGFRKAEDLELSARSSFPCDLGQVTETLGACLLHCRDGAWHIKQRCWFPFCGPSDSKQLQRNR